MVLIGQNPWPTSSMVVIILFIIFWWIPLVYPCQRGDSCKILVRRWKSPPLSLYFSVNSRFFSGSIFEEQPLIRRTGGKNLQMSAIDHSSPRMDTVPPLTVTTNWKINDSDFRTVKVSNVSLAASDQDIKEFFSFSGDIEFVEMQSESARSQLAYVTFKDPKGAETAMLLSGATIIDRSVNITPAENCQPPPSVFPPHLERKNSGVDSAVRKAEDMVSSMLAKGFVLGKDALYKAKALDERHHLILNASATVASLDQKMGLSEKLSIGTAVVNEKVREVDERFQVYEKTRSALAVAEQTASSASSMIMSNHYVSTGASWVWSALNMVAKAAEDVTSMTKEKVEKAEEEKKEIIYRERTGIVNNFAQIHLDDDSAMIHLDDDSAMPEGEPPLLPIDSMDGFRLGTI